MNCGDCASILTNQGTYRNTLRLDKMKISRDGRKLDKVGKVFASITLVQRLPRARSFRSHGKTQNCDESGKEAAVWSCAADNDPGFAESAAGNIVHLVRR